MDTHPHRPDDVSELERRLSAWAPASEGLDPDAMLFAAGRAAARTGLARFVWPALTGCLAVLAVMLGSWAIAERSERLALAEQIRQRPAAPAPTQPTTFPPEAPAEGPAPNSLLAGHRALEHGLDAWPPQANVDVEPPGPPAAEVPVLQIRQHDALLDP